MTLRDAIERYPDYIFNYWDKHPTLPGLILEDIGSADEFKIYCGEDVDIGIRHIYGKVDVIRRR